MGRRGGMKIRFRIEGGHPETWVEDVGSEVVVISNPRPWRDGTYTCSGPPLRLTESIDSQYALLAVRAHEASSEGQ